MRKERVKNIAKETTQRLEDALDDVTELQEELQEELEKLFGIEEVETDEEREIEDIIDFIESALSCIEEGIDFLRRI